MTITLDFFGPPRINETSKIYGIVVGLVTNNEDPEKLGRVKVKIPRLSDEDETDWARVASFMAGKDRGGFYLPEVDDEVLVAFEYGDIGMPYVIGSLWNGKDTPPETNEDGKNNIRVIKSRCGHKITFDDSSEEKKEKIEILTNGGQSITLDDTDGKRKIEIKSTSGHVLTLDDTDGSEKIEVKDKTGSNMISIDSAENTITIKCDKDIVLDASSGKVSIKAKDFEVKASGSAKIEASSNMDIKAGGDMNVKGSTVNLN